MQLNMINAPNERAQMQFERHKTFLSAFLAIIAPPTIPTFPPLRLFHHRLANCSATVSPDTARIFCKRASEIKNQ